MYSLPYDSNEAILHLSQADAKMAALVAKVGNFDLQYLPILSPFESLVESIIYQQISGKAASTIHQRFLALFPEKAHPSPQDILESDDKILRTAGISANKAKALTSLAEKTLEGLVPQTLSELERLSDAQIKANLTQIRGIGIWTVEMMLIFNLGRPDVFPATDFGVQNGYRIWYETDELPKPKFLAQFAERFQPFRSVAAWYLWRAVDLAKSDGNL